MKAAVFLLACLPVVLCEKKKVVLGTDCTGKYSDGFGHLCDLLHRHTFKNDVQIIDSFGHLCDVLHRDTIKNKVQIIDSFGHLCDVLHREAIKNDVQMILNSLGSDPTEAACQAMCMELLNDGSNFASECLVLCGGVQTIANQYGLVPQTQTSGGSP